MVNDPSLLHDVRPYTSSCTVANNQLSPVTAIGSVQLVNHNDETITLQNALLVPNLQHNLISLSRADAAGMSYNGSHGALMLKHNGHQILRASLINNLYEVECMPQYASENSMAHAHVHTAQATTASMSEAMIWHRRLGHVGFKL